PALEIVELDIVLPSRADLAPLQRVAHVGRGLDVPALVEAVLAEQAAQEMGETGTVHGQRLIAVVPAADAAALQQPLEMQPHAAILQVIIDPFTCRADTASGTLGLALSNYSMSAAGIPSLVLRPARFSFLILTHQLCPYSSSKMNRQY